MRTLANIFSDLKSKKSQIISENRELEELMKGIKIEKADERALIIAGMTTIIPIVLGAFGLLYLLLMIIFKI